MATRFHRLTVVVCALSWFMLGLHRSVLHELVDHGHVAPLLLALTALFAVVGVGTLWMLLRAPAPSAVAGADRRG